MQVETHLNEFLDIPFEQYLEDPAYSRSDLWDVHTGTLDCFHRTKRGKIKKSSDALKLGSAFHCAVLEPDAFATKYTCYTERRGTKAYKAFLEENGYEEEHVLTEAQFRWLTAASNYVMQMPMMAKLLDSGEPERSIFTVDDLTGLETKARPDLWVPEYDIMVDPKTVVSLDTTYLIREIKKHGYDLQAVHYMEAAAKAIGFDGQPDWQNLPDAYPDFVFCFVKKTLPVEVRLWKLPIEAIQSAASTRRAALNTLAMAVQTDKWPGYRSDIEIPDWPEWAI